MRDGSDKKRFNVHGVVEPKIQIFYNLYITRSNLGPIDSSGTRHSFYHTQIGGTENICGYNISLKSAQEVVKNKCPQSITM